MKKKRVVVFMVLSGLLSAAPVPPEREEKRGLLEYAEQLNKEMEKQRKEDESFIKDLLDSVKKIVEYCKECMNIGKENKKE